MLALLSIPTIDHLHALKAALEDARDYQVEITTKDNADSTLPRYHRICSMLDEVEKEFERIKEETL